eukprot:8971809-Alexandrium_andersonii.AAC.1
MPQYVGAALRAWPLAKAGLVGAVMPSWAGLNSSRRLQPCQTGRFAMAAMGGINHPRTAIGADSCFAMTFGIRRLSPDRKSGTPARQAHERAL